MSEEIDENYKKKEKIEDELLKTSKIEFKWFFLQKTELQASYMTGMYYQITDYLQSEIIKTKGLQKQMRYLIDNIDFDKLLKIFSACNKVLFAIQHKNREKYLRYTKIRSKTEELLAKEHDKSVESHELSVAFMMGYDAFSRTYKRIKEE